MKTQTREGPGRTVACVGRARPSRWDGLLLAHEAALPPSPCTRMPPAPIRRGSGIPDPVAGTRLKGWGDSVCGEGRQKRGEQSGH